MDEVTRIELRFDANVLSDVIAERTVAIPVFAGEVATPITDELTGPLADLPPGLVDEVQAVHARVLAHMQARRPTL